MKTIFNQISPPKIFKPRSKLSPFPLDYDRVNLKEKCKPTCDFSAHSVLYLYKDKMCILARQRVLLFGDFTMPLLYLCWLSNY